MREKAIAFAMSEAVEQDPFERLFLQNYRRVYEFLYRMTGQRMEAEDLTIETFMRYARRPPANAERPTGWLYRVATRLGYNALRASRRRIHNEAKASLYIAGDSSDPFKEVERSREQHQVHAVLQKMSRRSAQILLLHHSGFTYREIAEAIAVSPTSMGTLLCRAQKEFERLYLSNAQIARSGG